MRTLTHVWGKTHRMFMNTKEILFEWKVFSNKMKAFITFWWCSKLNRHLIEDWMVLFYAETIVSYVKENIITQTTGWVFTTLPLRSQSLRIINEFEKPCNRFTILLMLWIITKRNQNCVIIEQQTHKCVTYERK